MFEGAIAFDALRPAVSLGDHIRRQVETCQHEHQGLFAKTASNGVLMYLVCCMNCGATIPQPKGALAHQKIAARFDVSQIPDKSHADDIVSHYQEQCRYQRSLIYASYEAYLESPEWAALREQVIGRDGFCVCCGSAIQHVHHITYERLYRERLEDLAGVCEPCHLRIHDDRP